MVRAHALSGRAALLLGGLSGKGGPPQRTCQLCPSCRMPQRSSRRLDGQAVARLASSGRTAETSRPQSPAPNRVGQGDGGRLALRARCRDGPRRSERSGRWMTTPAPRRLRGAGVLAWCAETRMATPSTARSVRYVRVGAGRYGRWYPVDACERQDRQVASRPRRLQAHPGFRHLLEVLW